MSKSLFDAFEIDIGEPNPDGVPPATPSSPFEDMLAQDAAIASVRKSLPETFTRHLNQLYLFKIADKIQKSGEVAFYCARCWKPIKDYKQLHIDEGAGLVYGTECAQRIRDKQQALKYHHRGHNVRTPAEPDELSSFTCSVWGKDFQGLPENVRHCGSTPRLCAACPGTAVRNKNVLCDFERAIRNQVE